MTTHDCGKPNCAGICAAGLTETHRRQKDVATGYEDGIAEGRRQMAEEAAAMLERTVAGAIDVFETGLRSDPDDRQRNAWEAARDVMLVTVAPLATRIRALVKP